MVATQGMETLTDEEFFPLMADTARRERARRAFQELYERNAGFLYGSFRWVAPAVYYGKDDLLQDTFLRAFERAGNFKPRGLAADHAQRRVRAWLASIADRLIKEKWPRDRQGFVRLTQLTQECWQAMGSQEQPESEGPARVRQALSELAPRDRDIILIYMHWYDPELKQQRVPPSIVKQICAHYQVTKENFRQIVSRTLKRLEAVLT